MIVIADTMLLLFAGIAVAIAVKTDLKIREVPDWISYGLIAAAAIVRIMYAAITGIWSYVYFAIPGFLAMYFLGTIMFRTRQWGGGDAKLIMGLGIVFATKPFFVKASYVPFLMGFVVNTLLLGAIYGVVYSIFLAYKERKKFLAALKKRLRERRLMKIRLLAWSGAIILIGGSILAKDALSQVSIMGMAMLLLIYPYLWTFMKSIEDACLYRVVAAEKLTEGDWVDENVVVNKKLVYKKENTGIEKKDIQNLIKLKVKKILVKDGIPFTPTFLLSMIVSLWHGGIMSIV